MKSYFLSLIASLASIALTQFSPGPAPNFTEFFPITTFPKQQFENASRLIVEGWKASLPDTWHHFMHRCIRSQAYPEIGDAQQPDGFVEPYSPFKNVFFVGQSHWSSWAFDTGKGDIVLIDTLASPEEVERIILPGLQSHGYDASAIKHVFITHEHFDHFGGVRYLQDHFEPYIYASATAWKTMANVSNSASPLYYNYSKAVNVDDAETFMLDDFYMKTYFTPGHTPGTISLQFPVQDYDAAGTWHTAGLVGGGGAPSGAQARLDQSNSYIRWAQIARVSGMDVFMSNHQTQDGSLWNFDLLRYRKCSANGCNVDNPFVVGVDYYERYLLSLSYCPLLLAARQGQDLPGNVTDIDGRMRKRSVDDAVDIYDCHD